MTQKLGPIQQEFVDKLRSGDYLQGRVDLKQKKEDGKFYYCCLGIITEMLLEQLGGKTSMNGHVVKFEFGSETRNASLPRQVLKHVGFRGVYGDTTALRGTTTSLANMNDNGMSFNEIADFIEKNPEKVFTKEV